MRKYEDRFGNFVPSNRVRNGICAAVAVAMMQEYEVKRFAFCGIPEIEAEPVPGGMHVWMGIGSHVAGPLFIDAPEAIKIARKVEVGGTYEGPFFNQVQGLVVALEHLVSDSHKLVRASS